MSVYKTGMTLALMTALASGAAFAASSGDLEGKAAVNTKYPNELSAQANGSIPGPTSSTTRAQVSQEGQDFKKSPVTEDGWRETNGEVGATPDRKNLARSSVNSRNKAAVKSQGTNSSYPNDKAGSTPSTMRGSPDAAASSDSSMSGGVSSSAPSSTYGGVNTAQ